MSKTNQVFKSLILLFTLFVSFKSLAEGWGEIRICSENSNARHYTAVAQTQCSGLWGPKRASQARCVYDVEAQVKYYNVGGKVIAEQKTKFGPLGFSSTGGTYRNRCSRGGFINELMQTLTTNDEQGDSINEVCNITTGTIEFNNNEKTISINSINGYQSVD